ncbi:unnamed protein product [Enterobius vermicularis]|uniref:SCP domain-containing protein n=1 Tax=Enterobius vermicularis TaxID=51028 RepID=A0A0N4VD63_ENTVE|nr:unnamed protein product [Enterobius vermicularis]
MDRDTVETTGSRQYCNERNVNAEGVAKDIYAKGRLAEKSHYPNISKSDNFFAVNLGFSMEGRPVAHPQLKLAYLI